MDPNRRTTTMPAHRGPRLHGVPVPARVFGLGVRRPSRPPSTSGSGSVPVHVEPSVAETAAEGEDGAVAGVHRPAVVVLAGAGDGDRPVRSTPPSADRAGGVVAA